MVRVTKPGGRVAILDFTARQSRVIAALYRFYFHRVLPTIGRFVSPKSGDAYRYLPQSVETFPEGERMLEAMRKAGLESPWQKRLTFGIASLYVGVKAGGFDNNQPRRGDGI